MSLSFQGPAPNQNILQALCLVMGDRDSSVLNLYLQIAPAELFRLLQRQSGHVAHAGIYSARLVIWPTARLPICEFGLLNCGVLARLNASARN